MLTIACHRPNVSYICTYRIHIGGTCRPDSITLTHLSWGLDIEGGRVVLACVWLPHGRHNTRETRGVLAWIVNSRSVQQYSPLCDCTSIKAIAIPVQNSQMYSGFRNELSLLRKQFPLLENQGEARNSDTETCFARSYFLA